MANGKQITLSFKDSLDRLQKSLEHIPKAADASINEAIKGVAEAAYASILAKAQQDLHSTRQDYLSGLRFEALEDGSFLLSLEGEWPSQLEGGFSKYDLGAKMLASKASVSAGSRAGEPWVQTSKPRGKDKTTHKYARVPFPQGDLSAASATADLSSAIQSMKAKNTRGSGRNIKLSSIFRDSEGNPLTGKVAVGRSDNPKLDGLVKYQSVTKTPGGKNKVRSTYITYRTISEIGRPWVHPGFGGLHAFAEAEQEISKQIDAILKSLL